MGTLNSIRLPLKPDFHYFHEPLTDEFIDQWAVGRTQTVRELADRVMFSRGGAFLLSGMRGVGKTTFVRHAMHTIRQEHSRYVASLGPFELVDVWLNLARPVEPVQLLHLLIRHLYFRLKETGTLQRLHPELQEDLSTAFLRTSFEISSRSIRGEERSRGMEVGFGKAPWLGIEFLGKISSSNKQSHSDEGALKYLPYDDMAAEFELLSFSRRLLTDIGSPAGGWQRLIQYFRRSRPPHTAIKVVFVLDELDKLECLTGSEKVSPLAPIFQSLKTVLSASGMSFIFIGGKEAEEQMLEDVSHGDSIYESIFSYNLYLPCLWTDQDQFMLRSLAAGDTQDPGGNARTIGLYLRYKGRGIPRRIWREFNKYVDLETGLPALRLELAHVRYMKIFAKLESSIQEDELFAQLGTIQDDVRVDRKRLFFYYIADWILSRDHETFSENEVIEVVKGLNLGGSLKVSEAERIARNTVRLLHFRAFIERADQSVVRLATRVEYELFRVCPWVLRALEGLPDRPPTLLDPDDQQSSSTATSLTRIGTYVVVEDIGSGGTSNVYKVRHPLHEKYYAAKILRPEMTYSQTVRDFFRREVESTRSLGHPGVVKIYDFGEESGRPYYIMDLLDGVTLGTLLDSLKTLDVSASCFIAGFIASIAEEIHSRGFFRLDIKPNNVYLTRDGEVKLLDLGILIDAAGASLESGSLNRAIGTIGYMAPEQIIGPDAIDSRVDIYSLGMVLYECLVGELPFRPDEPLSWAGLAKEVPPLATCIQVPETLSIITSRMLARNPRERYASMTDVKEALAGFAEDGAASMHQAIERCKATRTKSREATEIGLKRKSQNTKDSTAASSVPLPPAASAPSGSIVGMRKGVSPVKRNGQLTEPPPAPSTSKQDRPSTIAPGPGDVSEVEARERRKLWSGTRIQQELALSRLCKLTATPQLVFDFRANVCIWSGLEGAVRTVSMDRLNLILGRNASQVDFPLEDPTISRQHVVFHIAPSADGQTVIHAEDLSSAAGTTVNHVSLANDSLGTRKLSDGDLLHVGARDIRIHVLPKDRTLILEPEIANEDLTMEPTP